MPVRRPSTTPKFVRYFTEFTVGTVVGLAPFLGLAKVPGFAAVIEIYPIDLREWLIPLSAIMMGMVAVIVQFVFSERPKKKTLRRWFIASIALFFIAFLLLIVVYPLVVTRIEHFAVVTGSTDVPAHPPGSRCTCPEGQPADQCLADITLNPINVRSCFGTRAVTNATLQLALLYIALTGAFAASVALVLLTDLMDDLSTRGRSRRK